MLRILSDSPPEIKVELDELIRLLIMPLSAQTCSVDFQTLKLRLLFLTLIIIIT